MNSFVKRVFCCTITNVYSYTAGNILRKAQDEQNRFLTITAEIQARSFARFYGPYADRRQGTRAGNSTICYRFLMRLFCY